MNLLCHTVPNRELAHLFATQRYGKGVKLKWIALERRKPTERLSPFLELQAGGSVKHALVELRLRHLQAERTFRGLGERHSSIRVGQVNRAFVQQRYV